MSLPNEVIVSTSKLTAIGDAIRSKTGGQSDLTLDEMATAVGTIGSLPSEYQQVDYIAQSSTGCYFTTDNYIKATDTVYLKLYLPSAKFVAWQNIFGSIDTSQPFPNNCIKACQISYSGNNKYIGLNRGGNGYDANKGDWFDKVIELRVISEQPFLFCYKDWTVDTVGNTSARNVQDSVEPYRILSNGDTGIRIYDIYIIGSNGSQKAHLIPCYRKSDNQIGLYDIINGQFYTNAGSGSFTCYPAPSN